MGSDMRTRYAAAVQKRDEGLVVSMTQFIAIHHGHNGMGAEAGGGGGLLPMQLYLCRIDVHKLTE